MKKILLLLSCILSIATNAQSVTHYDNSDGLINGIPSSIIEDNEGLLWFSDWSNFNFDGIGTFDGTNWNSYGIADGAPSNSITSSYQDSNGLYWFTTFNDFGVSSYDGISWINYTEADGLVDNFIWQTKEDSQGNLWFSGVGLSKFDGSSFTNYATIGGAAFAAISMAEDAIGNLWFATSIGLVKFDGTDFEVFTTADGYSSNDPTSVLVDSNDNLWVASFDGTGIDKFDGTTITNYSFPDGIFNVHVRSSSAVFEGDDGKIYFGTNFGIAVYDNGQWGFIGLVDGLLDEPIRALIEDEDGILWIGHFGGLTKYNPFLGVTETLFEDWDLYPNPVKSKLNINAQFSIDKVEVYSQLGSIVATFQNSDLNSIDVSNLSKGLYHVKVTSENQLISVKKVIVQ